MTETAEMTSASPHEEGTGEQSKQSTSDRRNRKGSGLDSMVLAELKQLASSLGIKGTGAMRKGQLIEAIQSAQRGPGDGAPVDRGGQDNGHSSPQDGAARAEMSPARWTSCNERRARLATSARRHRCSSTPYSLSWSQRASPAIRCPTSGKIRSRPAATVMSVRRAARRRTVATPSRSSTGHLMRRGLRPALMVAIGRTRLARIGKVIDGIAEAVTRGRVARTSSVTTSGRDNQQRDNQGRDNQGRDWDEDGGGRRSRRRRSRDRQNRRSRGSGGNLERYDEPVISEDDVLVPARGILDVLDNYAFVRTNGYLPGSDDAYVSLSLVKKLGLRKGDLVTGVIRTPREGERKEKFNPMVRIDTVNGAELDGIRQRPDFAKLTPLYPQERLKLETTPNQMAGRIIDLVAPIGKGQRALLVSPSKAGKTLIMQAIANSVAINNPEVKLMVVLVDERPEEVTDFERSAKGEVISSTFDRPAEDHTAVAELAIERAKRLVELGHDVVILLDGITRLSRAYNLAAPASGRILSGGVDSAALYPPKKFLGAARNIEGGGSLTIIATALIETGSKMDEVIFEEFKGTGNSEIRLRREFAEKRIFPAIDVDASSTRREELLMSREELAIVWKLRRVLSGLESLQGLEMLLDRLRKTQSNAEFLMAITKTIPSQD